VSDFLDPPDPSTPLRLVLLGDSIAAGTGASDPTYALGAQLAGGLRRLLASRPGGGRAVDLHVLAVPGATSHGLADQLEAALPLRPDVAVVIIGANDLIQLVPPPEAIAMLADTITRLRGVGAAVVGVTAPDLSIVPSIPPEYRAVLGEVSEEFATAQEHAIREAGGIPASLRTQLGAMFTEDPTLFSDDAFHPSDGGYAALADALLPFVQQALHAAGHGNGAAA
jgi:lysophospholipase L1-like esterase